MKLAATRASLDDLASWRDQYRLELDCQIIHDSIHRRPGWTEEYVLTLDQVPAGYGSLAIAGPWQDKPTVYEFYVEPPHRSRLFDLFAVLLTASGATMIETQSNDPLLTAMLHAFAPSVASESILFHDRLTTSLAPRGAVFRTATAAEFPDLGPEQMRWHGVVELDGQAAAQGGILFHYNRPYGDIFMEVTEPFRRRGLGAFLVQELKRIAREGGHIPAARCRTNNLASRRTLQQAGFVPCGHLLTGSVSV